MNKYITTMIGTVVAFALFVGIVGVAVAAPQTAPQQGITTPIVQTDAGWYGQMLEFMDRYRTPDGRFDANRMMADVTTGRTTPPCGGPNAQRGYGDPREFDTQPQRDLRGYGDGYGEGYDPGYGYGPMMGYETY